MVKEIKLKVAEAVQDDVNKGIVRIDANFLRELNARQGDIIEIEGQRKTIAIVDRAYPSDIGLDFIRMDGLTRKNSRTGIGEQVTIRKATIKEAKKVTIAPAREGVVIRASSQMFKPGLLGRAVIKGDIISVGGTRRRKTTMSGNPLFDEMFSMFDEGLIGIGFGDIKFIIVETDPKQAVLITENTELTLNPEAIEVKEEATLGITYEDIGGLQDEIKKIREMVELPLKHPEIFERLGIEPPKGVLLHGPPGTGKTLLAKAVANETNSHFILINGPEIMSKFYGESENNIRKKFEEAEKNAPSIIFIDEIDAIAAKREETKGEVERRVVAQLLALMDGLKNRGKVVVIAATNVPNLLDPALRRPGRFDRELEIGVPNKDGRLNILKIHTRNMPLAKDVDLKEFAALTHGFVGADLASLSKEAAMIVLRRVLPDLKYDNEEAVPKEILEKLFITKTDFKDALKVVRPSALREVFVELPNVKWEDVGGLDKVRQELIEAVEWPLKHSESFTRLGVKPPKGILLYGPPGTGKTMIAKAVANESEANFISIKGPELLCISGNTPILTSRCGMTRIDKFYERIIPDSKLTKKTNMYEIRKLTKPVYTFALAQDGTCNKTLIKTVHKLWVSDAYALKFSNNAQLIGSVNQPLFTFRNNNTIWVPIKDIKKGDYVAYPYQLGYLNKTITIPLPKYKHIRIVKQDTDAYYVKIFSAKEITRLPKKITIQLASFLGWFVSEGNISKEAITICNYDKNNQKEIIKLFTQFVDKKRITRYKDRVVIYSTPLIKYLETILEQPLGQKKSYTINCPSLLAKCRKEIITSFLKSAYKGDGCIASTKIEYASKSQKLTEGIVYLLTILGIKAKYWKRSDKMYAVTISGKREMTIFKNKVFGTKELISFRTEYNAQYKIPPISNILKLIKQKAGLLYDKHIHNGSFEQAISGRKRIGLFRLQKIMKLFEKYVSEDIKNTPEFNMLKLIAQGKFLWTQVTSKKPAKSQLMFDVETEDHSFIGGNIPLLLHNSKWVGESEKAVREVFKKARQTAPTIIFFDEIDSLAPRRSASSDSHVTERVVNQLLTEIDGLETLHDIVIIGATNRPDMLDTALLRPGRFDRIILTPVPDKKSRVEILKLHTKGMPLKNVDIEEIAEKTEGYVGADIESICREAAILALREDMTAKEIGPKHFEEALKKVRASVTKEIEKEYEKLQDQFRTARAKAMKEEKPVYFG